MRHQVIASLLCLIALPSWASYGDYQAYFGADGNYRVIQYAKEQGRDFFRKPDAGYGFYAGYHGLSWIDVEAGFQTNVRNTANETWLINTIQLNSLATNTRNFELKTKMDSLYARFLFYTPLSHEYFIDGILLTGISRTRINLEARLLSINGTAATLNDKIDNNFDLTQSKFIPSLGAGIRFRVTEHIGFRALIALERTTILNPKGGGSVDTPGALEAKLTNSAIVSFGILFTG